MLKILQKLLLLAVLLSFASCEKGYMGFTGYLLSGADGNVTLYQGAIRNTYYRQNFMGDKATMIMGKPFMAVKFDKTSNKVLDFEFGLSEVLQSAVGPNSIPEPTMDADNIDYQKKLNLKSPVALLVNWPVTAWDQTITTSTLSDGGYTFSYRSYGATKFTFSYLPAGIITGGAENLDGTGIETETESTFNMLEK